jgi:polar amino acid transport system substrate-binding protein
VRRCNATPTESVRLNRRTRIVNAHNLRKLVRGRIDCYVNARASIGWNLTKLREKGAYDPAETELVESTVIRGNWGYVGFSRANNPEHKEAFIKALNAEIKTMRENGRIREIFEQYLSTAGS